MKNNSTNDNNINNNKSFYDIYNNFDIEKNKTIDSQETIITNSSNKTILINTENKDENSEKRKKEMILKKIDHFYYFSKEKQEEENKNLPLDIEIKEEDYDEIDSIDDNLDKFLNKNINENSKLMNLLKSINNIKNLKIFSNKYFRFPIKRQKKTIYCIPEIKFDKGHLLFIYDNEVIFLSIEEIIELNKSKELFINKNKKDILNQAYICQVHNKKYVNYCPCKNNICSKCKEEEHICHNNLYMKKIYQLI